eukprot:TRINITY_DN4783_c0_g2_i2.p1 TRINITY_DN4783_c0_g2~~TRINITY_DN4783_c0_g2_i2.p1  ORF type:complete len:471 (+),score=127.14 TRINITY_DN4783_c0_g2_i2:3-1415(+)
MKHANSLRFIAFIGLFLLGVLAVSHERVKAPKPITNLPGLTQSINFKQYSGYLSVSSSRRLFYWFVESQNSPSSDPVVLWLNGGPGCSSLGGLLTEHGPFRPNSDGKTLSLNPSSWNKVANVIYLESPAGVGFSYSTNTSDYTVGDARTADDAYHFLIGFFKTFPQFAKNDFYVSGESYGGHYVTTLTERILKGNKEGKNPKLSLKGFLVGNAWTDATYDNIGAVFYWWSHALISDEAYEGILKNCDFSNIGPLSSAPDPTKCNQWIGVGMSSFSRIDIYDIYVDVCLGNRNRKIVEQYARAGSVLHQALLSNSAERTMDPPYQPCLDNYVHTYLNRPDVRKVLGVEVNSVWHDCSPIINYNYTDLLTSVIPLYQKFFDAKLKVLVYSGDVDAIVPVTGSRAWISTLKQPIVRPWTAWTLNGQTGGFVTKYQDMLFATVRGAGHMVPETQPERALALFSRFLKTGDVLSD